MTLVAQVTPVADAPQGQHLPPLSGAALRGSHCQSRLWRCGHKALSFVVAHDLEAPAPQISPVSMRQICIQDVSADACN